MPADDQTDEQQGEEPQGAPGEARDDPPKDPPDDEKKDEPKFTQADLDRIVKQRADRIIAQRYGDYDEKAKKAAEYDKALDAQKTAEQRAQADAEKARKERDQLRTRAVRGEIKALAAGKFADPDDPGGFLDVTRYVNDAGEIDTDAITADLDELLSRKPHLAKVEDKPRPPAPNRAQGSSGNGAPTEPTTPGMGTLRAAYRSSTPRRR